MIYSPRLLNKLAGGADRRNLRPTERHAGSTKLELRPVILVGVTSHRIARRGATPLHYCTPNVHNVCVLNFAAISPHEPGRGALKWLLCTTAQRTDDPTPTDAAPSLQRLHWPNGHERSGAGALAQQRAVQRGRHDHHSEVGPARAQVRQGEQQKVDPWQRHTRLHGMSRADNARARTGPHSCRRRQRDLPGCMRSDNRNRLKKKSRKGVPTPTGQNKSVVNALPCARPPLALRRRRAGASGEHPCSLTPARGALLKRPDREVNVPGAA